MRQSANFCGKITNEVFLFVLLFTATLPTDKFLPDSVVAPRWYATLFVASIWGAIAMLIKKRSIDLNLCTLAVALVCAFQVSIYFLQIVGLLHVDGGETACFSNAAGLSSCLCFSVPALWHYSNSHNISIKVMTLCAIICSIVVIMHLQSRAGLVCLALFGYMLIKRKRPWNYVYAATIFFMLPLLFWILKPASTLGRWFIIQRTASMITQHPLAGWGIHGFQANYMHVQAAYLASHTDTDYAQLAGNICHPLNEYMFVIVNFGLIGFLLIALFVWCVLCYYCNHKSLGGLVGIQTISLIAVFSLFSYPFSYPFTWVVFIISLYLIFKGCLSSRMKKIYTKPLVLVFLLTAFLPVKAYQCGAKWEKLIVKVNDGYKSGIRLQYENLYPVLHYNERFLYNYAYTLYRLGLYEESLNVAFECETRQSDYYLSLLLGDINSSLGNDDVAVKYFLLAHHMCPCRFEPLCAIYDVYKNQHDYEKCKMMSKIISEKPVKVDSPETLEYIDYVKRDIKELREHWGRSLIHRQ